MRVEVTKDIEVGKVVWERGFRTEVDDLVTNVNIYIRMFGISGFTAIA